MHRVVGIDARARRASTPTRFIHKPENHVKAARSLCALSVAVATVFGLSAVAPAQAQVGDARVRVAVAWRDGSSVAVRAAIARHQGRVLAELGEVKAVVVSMPASRVAALRAAAGVDFVEGEIVHRMLGSRSARVETLATEVVGYNIPMVQADLLPPPGPGSERKKLCIIDSGIDGTHPDLADNNLAGANYTTSGTWDTDESSHGTHVAGTAVALKNGIGLIGVAPNKEIDVFVAKVFDSSGSASSLQVAQAMLGCLRARSNVLNMSLGSDTPSRLLERIADLLASRNILVIAAAGNNGTSALHYPAGFASVMSVAAVNSGTTVADFSQFNPDVEIAAPGVDIASTVPPFSQTGATATVGESPYAVEAMEGSPRTEATGALADFGLGETPSPGSMTGKVCLISRGNISFADKVLNCQTSGGVGAIIYNNAAGPLLGTLGTTVTTIPSVGALQADGATMLTQVGQSTTVSVFGLPEIYAKFNGTSMATPHASAVAALVWTHFPACTAAQIRAHMTASALDLGAAGRDDFYGFGLVQAKAMVDRITALGC